MKGPQAELFVALTHLALDLLERDYFDHFDFIVIICTTLLYNSTYRSRKWFWTDHYIITIEPCNHLYDYIEKIGNLLAGSKTLFLIDDIIANENLDKRRQPLPYQEGIKVIRYGSYTAVPPNIRRQAKILYVWCPKHRKDWDTIHEENDDIETPEELASVRKQLSRVNILVWL